MSVFTSVLLYMVALLGVGLGVLVFLRNVQSRSHRIFLGVSLANSAWIASNGLYGQVDDTAAYPVALASYALASAMTFLFLGFVADLNGYKLIERTWFWATGAIVTLGSLIPGVLATSVSQKNIITTPFILVYAGIIAVIFVVGTWLLIHGLRHQRGRRRRQLGVIFIGIIGSSIGAIVFNLLLPIYGDYRFVQLGPVFSSLFIFASGYAIVKHRLFDIRAAVVRVAAYTLTVLTVATLYVIVTYTIVVPFLNGSAVGGAGQLVYLGLTVLAALTFQPVKQFFDRATRAVFYKNAYDTQKVLDELGTLLVDEVEVGRLIKGSMKVLQNAIKPEIAQVILVKNGMRVRDIALSRSFRNPEELIDATRQKHSNLLVTDDLADRDISLHTHLSESGLAVVAPLITADTTIGYILLGYKISGDAFSNQDVNLIRIFADQLAVAVQNALRFEEIAHFNLTLKDEIADATSQLRESNKKLHKLDEAKDEFISMASHQLRTPLTSVKGYLSMVLEGDAGKVSPDQRKLLEEAYSSAQRMVYLIGDFLNVSRLQTGKFVLEAIPVNLAHLVREEVEQLQATAARRNIKLEYHEPAHFPELPLDDGKMRQVIMNFIDNALFYSRPNSTVTIELIANAREVAFKVHDTGIGVPVAERHHLFTKFYRASNARRVRPDGTGIGLYMAKKVIMAHDGSVIFATKENRGSTFGFTLPLKHQVE